MPTYQYQCTECGKALEVVQSFSDDALTECPECSGRLRKVFNAVGVVFKGSGFYRNDSRSTSADGSTSNGSASNGSASNGSAPKDTTTQKKESPTKSDSSTSTTTPASTGG